MRSGAVPCAINSLMRNVTTRVLPEPAPARTSMGPRRVRTAFICSELSDTVAASFGRWRPFESTSACGSDVRIGIEDLTDPQRRTLPNIGSQFGYEISLSGRLDGTHARRGGVRAVADLRALGLRFIGR